MSPGLTADLAFAGGIIFLAAWLLLWRTLGWRAALVLALLRVGLVVLYFGHLDDGSWRLRDDLSYTEESLELGAAAGGAGGALFNPEAGALFSAVAGGRHFGYYAHNLVSFVLFGNHYWSPVFLNVLLSFVAALGVLSMAKSCGFGARSRLPLAAAFLLHPDVVAWSGFFNLKDTLVMTLSTWILALMLRGLRGFKPLLWSGVLILAVLLFFVRSYAVVLLGAACLSWTLLHGRAALRLVVVMLALLALPFIPRAGLENFVPGNAPVGLVDFLLTPRPWGIVRDYQFLLIPSCVHWLLMPVTAWGVIWLWRWGDVSVRLPVIFAAILVAFYACVPLLAGPRHRFQLVSVLVAAQVAGIYALAREFLGGREGRTLGASGPGDDALGKRGGEGEWSTSST